MAVQGKPTFPSLLYNYMLAYDQVPVHLMEGEMFSSSFSFLHLHGYCTGGVGKDWWAIMEYKTERQYQEMWVSNRCDSTNTGLHLWEE